MSNEENSMSVKDVKEAVLELKKRADELTDENISKSNELEKTESQSAEVNYQILWIISILKFRLN